ncbi:MAG: class I SAM-dependent methyltransferase [Simkaniaceae bacterium]|nr:class I SAM-dependent methyltransferase [Simkaniaceae bacterium]
MTYAFIDSGNEQKLERFGDYTLIRPCPQALWKPQAPKLWSSADSTFKRGEKWQGLPKSWTIQYKTLQFKIAPTDFGHLGLFPEHAQHWNWMEKKLKPNSEVLNLFAYSGAATLYLAKKGHQVCHLDAAKGMIDWARENAALNTLEKAPIRWIIDDVFKFLRREINRKRKYDSLLVDPPSFGRGSQRQVFKIERDLLPLLKLCKQVLKTRPSFILLTCHTPGLTPKVLCNILGQLFPALSIDSGEMLLPSQNFPLPSGCFARG